MILLPFGFFEHFVNLFLTSAALDLVPHPEVEIFNKSSGAKSSDYGKHYVLKKTRPCRVTLRHSISNDEQIASSVANQIWEFAIVYE